MKREKLILHVNALIATLLWALGYIMTRIAIRHFSVEAVSFLRYFTAAIALIVFALIKRMKLPKVADLPLFFFGGAIGIAVYVYAINAGAKTLNAAAVSFIISTSPIVTAFLARIFLKEKMGIIGGISLLCALCGVGVITIFDGEITLNKGVIWLGFATLLISSYNIFQRKLLKRYDPLSATSYCIIAGAVLLSVFAVESFPQLVDASLMEISAILVLGIFSGGIAYVCWSYALSKAEKTNEVTNYMFLTPILTTFLGQLLINEAPTASIYIGGMMVLGGVLLFNNRDKFKKTKKESDD